ncbi:unnamed protein product [Ilex paraguariensis]|uniref:C2H2-type domain-containing protein n=1 Tax=Ilex paraguariensis TaxID=185542 RepID=A0ABC8UPR5_9AQUA
MIRGATTCFTNGAQGLQIYGVKEDLVSSSIEPSSVSNINSDSLLYNLSVLKDKVHHVQSLVSLFISPNQSQPPESTDMAMASMGTVLQEIIVTTSSMMFTCQQMALGATTSHATTHELQHHRVKVNDGMLNQPNCGGDRVIHVLEDSEERGQEFYSGETTTLDWYGENNYNTCNTNDHNINRSTNITGRNNIEVERRELAERRKNSDELQGISLKNYDIIEVNASDLLAKYTHYCQVCGKGFKRDANLRMHMRAHGDEYKSNAALSKPTMNNVNGSGIADNLTKVQKKYSCPQEGCRWNQKHAKFHPLKSMICVKNHYRRSHCPKMYVCKRCNQKQFSVLSDLKTHEKHCGDIKWQCSCGTTFSRKDKLMGHVALFVGHTPAVSSIAKMGKFD